MLIQELHDASRETLSNFFYNRFKITPVSQNILQCLREMRGAATNYRMQTERHLLRAFAISVKPGSLLYFFVIHK